QQRAVVHANTSNPDDSTTLSAANLVVLTATVSDGDGDQASAPLNVGLQLVFKDDGPTITVDDSSGNFSAGAQGNWSQAPGNDGFKSLSLTLTSYAIGGGSNVTLN